MNQSCHIACDLGAESGRVILGMLGDGRLTMEEIHRFPNNASRALDSLRWDVLRIFEELKTGLRKIAERKIPVQSVSVDSWGVDYVFVRENQPMLGAPYHYRDLRSDRGYELTLDILTREEIFAETGIQFMPFNTIYQLVADQSENAPLLEAAERFLLIGDYFNWLFSGVPRAERSLASTTQIYNPATGQWSVPLREKLGLRPGLFPEIVPSGTRLGPLLSAVAAEVELPGVEVVATCSHDTGAAVAAVPAEPGGDWAYLSCGTWSLIGVELDKPLIGPGILAQNFANEVGFGGSIRFLKNIVGLWILQECRRSWEKAGESCTYEDLTRLAGEAEPLRSLINPNAARFLRPDNMPEKILAYCRETGQPGPESPGQYVRAILESLALLYGETMDVMEKLTGRTLRRLHIVGGGSRNQLLDQFAANATGREVIAGPAEATAMGNLLIQAVAMGHLSGLEDLRRVVRASTPVQKFTPASPEIWQSARARFRDLDILT